MPKNLINPDLYHGNNKKNNFFEGWYFKIVQPSKNLTYCFIPGIFLSSKENCTHSFIQVLKGHEASFKYLKYNQDEFITSKTEFNIAVGESSFSLKEINLNINQENEKIREKLSFSDIVKWPDSIINPGSMGFYNYLTFMQCYSQVCAVDGCIEGHLNINGEVVDFTGGNVYIEKNWGKEFPYSYIWVQGNSFSKGNGAVTCSIGHIPFLFTSFTGFLIGAYIKGRFYKFTTINKSTLSFSIEKEKLTIDTYNKNYFLKIEALYKNETFLDLFAPRADSMIDIASESLQGSLALSLYDRKRQCMIFNDTCSSAGIEFSGDYKGLNKRIKKKGF